jgi:hypothetical protein
MDQPLGMENGQRVAQRRAGQAEGLAEVGFRQTLPRLPAAGDDIPAQLGQDLPGHGSLPRHHRQAHPPLEASRIRFAANVYDYESIASPR